MKAKRYTIEEAEKRFSKLVSEVQQGDRVYITRDGKPVVQVVGLSAGLQKRTLGGLKGKISWTPDAFDPLTDKEMKELGFE